MGNLNSYIFNSSNNCHPTKNNKKRNVLFRKNKKRKYFIKQQKCYKSNSPDIVRSAPRFRGIFGNMGDGSSPMRYST